VDRFLTNPIETIKLYTQPNVQSIMLSTRTVIA